MQKRYYLHCVLVLLPMQGDKHCGVLPRALPRARCFWALPFRFVSLRAGDRWFSPSLFAIAMAYYASSSIRRNPQESMDEDTAPHAKPHVRCTWYGDLVPSKKENLKWLCAWCSEGTAPPTLPSSKWGNINSATNHRFLFIGYGPDVMPVV